MTVTDRPNELRYEIEEGGEVRGFLIYRVEPGVLELVHTDVEPKWEGKGVGAALVKGTLDDVRALLDMRIHAAVGMAVYTGKLSLEVLRNLT